MLQSALRRGMRRRLIGMTCRSLLLSRAVRVRFVAGGFAAVLLVAVPAYASDVPGDVDCNGDADSADLAALVSGLFDGTTCAGADVNGDGRITAADLVAEVVIITSPPGPTATTSPTETLTPTMTAVAGGSPSATRTASHT